MKSLSTSARQTMHVERVEIMAYSSANIARINPLDRTMTIVHQSHPCFPANAATPPAMVMIAPATTPPAADLDMLGSVFWSHDARLSHRRAFAANHLAPTCRTILLQTTI
jgi:hypothetical protein